MHAVSPHGMSYFPDGGRNLPDCCRVMPLEGFSFRRRSSRVRRGSQVLVTKFPQLHPEKCHGKAEAGGSWMPSQGRGTTESTELAKATTTPTTVPRDSPLPLTIDGHQARERVVYLPFQDIVARSLLIRVLLRRVPRHRLPEPVQDRHDN